MAAGDSVSEYEEDESIRVDSNINIHINPILPTSNTWSMVSIRDNHDDLPSLIFPPINHENLHLAPPSIPALIFKHHAKPLTPTPFLSSSSSSSEMVDVDVDSSDDSSTSTLFSPSTDPESPPTLRASKTVNVGWWVNLGMGLVYSKVKWVLSFGSFRVSVKTAVMVMGFLYFWWRRRRGRINQEDRDRLVGIITEKDERINQLLNQIARMNAVLLALQRLPPSSSNTSIA